MTQIVKGLPMPAPRPDYGYRWGVMEIGDSFPKHPSQTEAQFRNSASMAGRRHGLKFSVRQWEGEVMCWRVD